MEPDYRCQSDGVCVGGAATTGSQGGRGCPSPSTPRPGGSVCPTTTGGKGIMTLTVERS